jgi:hypothetical protein
MCGMPTYVGIRRDVAERFDGLLRARIADDPANQESYRYWRRGPAPADREDKLYLSPGALSRPAFATIPLAERQVTVAAVGFASTAGTAGIHPHPGDLMAFLTANHKSTGVGPPGLRASVASNPRSLGPLAATAAFVGYRHVGEVGPLLDHVTARSTRNGIGVTPAAWR